MLCSQRRRFTILMSCPHCHSHADGAPKAGAHRHIHNHEKNFGLHHVAVFHSEEYDDFPEGVHSGKHRHPGQRGGGSGFQQGSFPSRQKSLQHQTPASTPRSGLRVDRQHSTPQPQQTSEPHKKKNRPSRRERLRLMKNGKMSRESSGQHVDPSCAIFSMPPTPPQPQDEYMSDNNGMHGDLEESMSPVSVAESTGVGAMIPASPPFEEEAPTERKKRNWKPYSQLTWEDKLALQKREKPLPPEIPEIPTDQFGKRRRGIALQDYVPLAPRNSSNHFMDAEENAGHITIMSEIPADVVQSIGLTPMMSRGGVESFFGDNTIAEKLESLKEGKSSEESMGLESDPALLLAQIESQAREIAELRKENATLKAENAELRNWSASGTKLAQSDATQ